MQTLMPWIAVAVTIVAGWALIKRYQTHMVLLFAGLVLLLCAAGLTDASFLPKGVKPSGFFLFDIFNTLKSIATKQSAGIGFLIMTAGGFAAYMDRIGAARALVDIAVKPLSMLKAPYLVLVGGYLVGQILVMVIPSAAGLAMLLLVALFPILKAVGTSAASAAAVIGTSAGMTFAPTAGTANLAAKVANLDPIIYLVQYQLVLAIPTLIVVCIAHYFVQRHYDRKNDDVYSEAAEVKASDAPAAPKVCDLPGPADRPSHHLLEARRHVHQARHDLRALHGLGRRRHRRDHPHEVRQKVCKDAMAMFQSMGKMFAGIVALIICAEFFATGLKVSGLIDALINSAQGIGAGMGVMTLILTAIVSAVTFLTGSGVGAYSSFASLAPDVAAGLGGSVAALVTPMQFASGMLRAMSPVAGVIIAVAGAAGISPMAVVRRTWIPMIAGMFTTIIANMIFFG